jgi:repressor of nif and glnA expression
VNQKKKTYVTLETGTDYRKIAEMMAQAGYRMNHATARNQLLLAMEKLLLDVARQAGTKISKEQLKALLNDQSVHDAIGDILYMIQTNKKKA